MTNFTAANGSAVAAAPSALSVRRQIYAHPVLTQQDVELVFDGMRKEGANPGTEWTNLFSEALTDYLVRQNDPPDHIPEDKAEWLMNELAKTGGISTKSEWRMLIDVMSRALSVPPILSAFALKEIATALITGQRSAFSTEDQPSGTVTKADADALRAILFAATTDSAAHVTREEAEVLFDIAHATAGGQVDPAFDELFARSVGNYLMAISLQVPTTAESLHREKWLDERETMGGFFSRTLSKVSMGLLDSMKSPLELADDDMGKREAANDAKRMESEKITETEAVWVLEHLTRGGLLTSAEKRLLQWLGAEAFALPPQLKALVDQVRTANLTPKSFGHRHVP